MVICIDLCFNFFFQVQNNKFVASQFTTDYRTDNSTASLTIGNPDIVNESGKEIVRCCISHYLVNNRFPCD